mmetsp:Transcript_134896/g.269167  ORF Transcript_134896/g.269167 Transcript_134896/m.269167 type:complete len:599 (+) Transcript_134896:111-1907(+)
MDVDDSNWGLVVDELRSFRSQLELVAKSQQKLEDCLLSNGYTNGQEGIHKLINNGMPAPPVFPRKRVPVVNGSCVGTGGEDSINGSLVDVVKNRRSRRWSRFDQENTRESSTPLTPLHSGEYAEQKQRRELQDIMLLIRDEQQMHRDVTQQMERKFGKGCMCLKSIINMAERSTGVAEKAELILDSIIGVVIFTNALFVGISMDSSPEQAAELIPVDICYGILFWGEMLLKLYLHGCRERYCGPEGFANQFDLALVLTDTAQLCIVFLAPDLQEQMGSSGMSASLFRVVRLMRLARVIRLLRSNIFKDLLTMFQGLIGGAHTLGWSFVLFMLFIYVVALVFRELIGPHEHDFEDEENVQWYFRSVPRSMMTVFRCSFGDCSDQSGTPIFEHVEKKFGMEMGLVFGGFIFVVMIGLFNVISAIFVESTLNAAAQIAAKKETERLLDKTHFSRHFLKLLACILEQLWGEHDEDLQALTDGRCTRDILDRVMSVEYLREDFEALVEKNWRAQHALVDLDIDKQDWRYLSDILDPDNSGTIGIFELLDGLQRLRGSPRRSDVIAVDLMLRSVQQKMDIMWEVQTRQTPVGQQDNYQKVSSVI